MGNTFTWCRCWLFNIPLTLRYMRLSKKKDTDVG